MPIVGGLDKSNDPPRVKYPEDVTVPDKLIPLTVPVPLTEFTVPEPLLLKVFQSVELKYPEVEAPACEMLMSGLTPPLDDIGLVPVTELTPAATGSVHCGAYIPAEIRTWPTVPATTKSVASVADWKGRYPAAPPARLVASAAVPPIFNAVAVPEQFVNTPAEGVPKFGVMSVGLVSTTNVEPVPV